MTTEKSLPIRCSRISKKLKKNLSKSDDPMEAMIATVLESCGNCETRGFCGGFWSKACGLDFDMVIEAFAQVYLNCGRLCSWKIDLREKPKVHPKPKIHCEWNAKPSKEVKEDA